METDSAPTASKSLTTLALEKLRSDILSGVLQPQERLRIQALSERYNIGATAIREALSRLVADDLVESEDQRGFCVARVSRDDLLDLTQTRVEIESLALCQAIEHGEIEWESNLVSSFHRLSKTPLPISPDLHADWAAAHRRFHEALVAGCRSPRKLHLCRLLADKSERYRSLAEQFSRPRPRERDTLAEHQGLMDAAIARDTKLATQLLSKHFWETTNTILKVAFGEGTRLAEPARPRVRKGAG